MSCIKDLCSWYQTFFALKKRVPTIRFYRTLKGPLYLFDVLTNGVDEPLLSAKSSQFLQQI